MVVTLLIESGDPVTTAISNERGVFGLVAPRSGGVDAGVETALMRRLSGYAAVGRDWLSFGSYREIERPWSATAATWRATSLRLGVAYEFAR